MKLLVLTYDFAPMFGGKTTMLRNFFERTTFEKTVLTVSHKDSAEYDKKQRFKIVRIPKILFNIPMPILRVYFFKVFFLFLFGAYLFLKKRPDLVIAGQLLSEGAAAYYLQKFFGAKYCLFVYDTIDGEAPFFSRDKGIAKKILENASKVFYISNFMKEKLIKQGAKESALVLLHPTADHEFFVPNLDTRQLKKSLGVKGKVILTVGRIVERKGIDKVINVLPVLEKNFPQIKYIVVGKGPQLEEYKELAKKRGVQESVIFTGFVQDNELPLYYNLCDVFVMASSYLEKSFISEGFGIVFLEANACAKPVIGVAQAGMTDSIIDGKTGLLLKEPNKKELQKAIEKILGNEEFANQLGLAGQKRIEQSLNWPNVVKKFEQSLLEVKSN